MAKGDVTVAEVEKAAIDYKREKVDPVSGKDASAAYAMLCQTHRLGAERAAKMRKSWSVLSVINSPCHTLGRITFSRDSIRRPQHDLNQPHIRRDKNRGAFKFDHDSVRYG